ncbi:MAG: two-component system response regulator CreB [Candidatus Methylacidiphilales bacterium]
MHNARVLIVEDEPGIAESLLFALETDGMKPVWVSTARTALETLVSGTFDLILLDIGIPDRNGFDLFREIRRQHTTPLIFLTARSEEIDRVAGLEMGADDYVVKPFSPRELTARIRAVLRRSHAESQPSAAIAETKVRPMTPNGLLDTPFEVDDVRKQIRYHGTRLELTRYEYRLLKTLIDSPGRVYSRDQLLEHAWDDPGACTDRTVDAHIKQLRAKLRAAHLGSDPILTHRGLGYSLSETTLS